MPKAGPILLVLLGLLAGCRSPEEIRRSYTLEEASDPWLAEAREPFVAIRATEVHQDHRGMLEEDPRLFLDPGEDVALVFDLSAVPPGRAVERAVLRLHNLEGPARLAENTFILTNVNRGLSDLETRLDRDRRTEWIMAGRESRNEWNVAPSLPLARWRFSSSFEGAEVGEATRYRDWLRERTTTRGELLSSDATYVGLDVTEAVREELATGDLTLLLWLHAGRDASGLFASLHNHWDAAPHLVVEVGGTEGG